MSKIKRLQRQLDRANKGTNNTTEATDSREEIVDVLGNKGGKLYDKINTPKSSYQGVAPIQGMSDEQARNIDEDTYPDGPSRKSALNMLGISSPLDKRGLWDNIHAKRKRGEAPNKPGDKGYPTAKALKDSQ